MRRTIALGVAALLGCRGSSLGYLRPPAESDGRAGLGQLGTQISEALRAEYRGQLAHAAPPIRLVPTDGSELALRALAATIAVDGPLARTELHFTFHNAEARVREGRFSITLPPDAAVARFAMKIDTGWREAKIVTREQGRQVYERFLHKRVDPALLERDLGNQFSARVYPIAANADKEIVIAYEHRVAETQPYVLALRGLPPIPSATVQISDNGVRRTIEHRGETLADIVVPASGGAAALAGDGAFVARVTTSTAPQPAPLERVLLLVDTSASRAPVMGRQGEVVRELLAALPATADVTVAAFDQEVSELVHAPAGGAGGAAAAAVLEHGALGASDLGAALARAAAGGYPRVIVVGDGAPTLGEREPAKLAALVAGSAIERIDAIQVGDALDRDTLAAVVGAGRAPGAILDGRDPARAARQLATALPPERPIRVDGAIATWPATTRGIAAGDPIWVFGLRTSDDARPLAIHIGDDTATVTPRTGERSAIRRAVASAEVDQLVASLAGANDPAAVVNRIEELALQHALITPYTSLLVLESDADEQRMLGPSGMQTIPVPGRTFEAVLGAAAGSQSDGVGVSFSGTTSLENTYIVDGINTTSGSYTGLSVGIDQQELVRRAKSSAFAFDPVVIPAGPPGPPAPPKEPDYAAPYTGTFRDVMSALAHGDRDRALATAARWQLASPGELAALVALGEALEARGAGRLAARAYGSIADLYPNRAELLRAAGERLERIPGARALALDAYRRAVRERPDQPSTYRLLAFALLRAGRGDEALDVLDEGARHAARPSVLQLLGEDAAWIAAQLAADAPARRDELARRVRGPLPTHAGMRIVLTWETDANDVDLHVRDRRGRHAYYAAPELASGGRLRDDLTDGFGPEVFAVDDPTAFPYRLAVHYYSRGPMGVGLGTVQVIRRDVAGRITIDDRPFVIQNDSALVDLGRVDR